MSEMEPLEEEQDDERLEPEPEFDDFSRSDKDEQSARSFFALISFFIAIIFLAIFISQPLSSITGLVVLLAVFAFGLGGVYLLTRKSAQEPSLHPSTSLQYREDHESGANVVDSTLERPKDEEELEEETDALHSFELLVEEALASIPPEFHEQMANLAIMVESTPDEEVLKRVGTKEGYTLLGLYQGVPLTAYGRAGAMLPEHITIYQHTIEAYCYHDPERIRTQVRSTILHEVAHHFGIDHEEMPIWIR